MLSFGKVMTIQSKKKVQKMLPADFSVVSAWFMNYLLSVPDHRWQLGDQWKFWLHLGIRAPSTISWSKKFGLGYLGAKKQWINMMQQSRSGGTPPTPNLKYIF